MQFTIDDLREPCTECEGRGKKEVPGGAPVHATSQQPLQDCTTCRGSGMILTEQGAVLKDFFVWLKAYNYLSESS